MPAERGGGEEVVLEGGVAEFSEGEGEVGGATERGGEDEEGTGFKVGDEAGE